MVDMLTGISDYATKNSLCQVLCGLFEISVGWTKLKIQGEEFLNYLNNSYYIFPLKSVQYHCSQKN